jgi:hypothetical protein
MEASRRLKSTNLRQSPSTIKLDFSHNVTKSHFESTGRFVPVLNVSKIQGINDKYFVVK